jgi:DNA-binding beta-propeller fold protein YncE
LGTFTVGEAPTSIAFDGTNIWVSNFRSSNVTKVRAFDGTIVGTFAAGPHPGGVIFDGAHIWVTNRSSDSLTQLQP